MTVTVRVAHNSKPSLVAGAIAGLVRDGKDVEVCAVGHVAVSKACVAVAMARMYLQNEVAIAVVPFFEQVKLGNWQRLLVRLRIIEDNTQR